MTQLTIRPRERDAVIQALRAGVVPRTGLQLIQVGRAREIAALVNDIDRIADGGGALRFVIGDYGSGKTFFLTLLRLIAHEKGLVTVHADFNPDRRLYGKDGQARSFLNELMRNVGTRTRPDAALAAVVERFVASAQQAARQTNTPVDATIHSRLGQLSELTNGYDFAEVIAQYWRGHDQGNEQLKSHAIRWLRGEFTTRTDARAALGVRTIVDDDQVYDHLKLFARFTRLAGYQGLLLCGDEMVNLLKIPNAQARNANYEQILRVLNDVLQGSAEGMGVVFGGTPDTLLDPRRGLYSYPAIETRLRENALAKAHGVEDTTGPVIRLGALTPVDLYVLLMKLREVYASGDPAIVPLPDEALRAFLAHCSQRVGAAYFQTPRAIVRAFLDMLVVLEQSPQMAWTDLIEQTAIAPDPDPEASAPPASVPLVAAPDDGLASFRL